MRRRERSALGLAVLGAAALVLMVPATSSSSSSRAVSETITVQAGQTATGKMRLVPGVTYHAVVSGSIRVEYSGGSRYELHDALYCFETNFPSGESPGHCPAAGNNPAQVDVALYGFSGQGSASCQSAGSCNIDLGSPGGKCCSSLPYASSHTYENDFEVGQPGELKVAADVLCRPGDSTRKCVSGAFSVQISEKTKVHGCQAPWAAGDLPGHQSRRGPTARAARILEVHVVNVCPDAQFHKGGFPADAWYPLELNTVLQAGDEVTTDPDGTVTLAFADNSTVVVSDLTQFKIGSFFTEGGVTRTEILLKMGQIAATVNKSEATKSDFRIKSPTGVSSVRGTVFSVFYDPGSRASITSVTRGVVSVQPANPKLRPAAVRAGREVEVTPSIESPLAPIGKAGARGGVDILKARSLVLAVVATHNVACATSTPRSNAFSIRPASGGWLVAVKLVGRLHGSSTWRVTGTKVRPANALAKVLSRSCH